MKKIVILAVLFLSAKLVLALEPFCGWSTYASCSKDSECKAGGCSSQVCEKIGEGTITTCEFKDCYVAEKYNLTCQCINNQCQWDIKIKHHPQNANFIQLLLIFEEIN
ncbi:MAG: eight-cysteine-cluster domain-containing protein [Candidatus Aenigmatarchaeota archaeon]